MFFFKIYYKKSLKIYPFLNFYVAQDEVMIYIKV